VNPRQSRKEMSMSLSVRNCLLGLAAFALAVLCPFLVGQFTGAQASEFADPAFVTISSRDPRYLALSDGRPYIPIGLNMIAPGQREEEAGLAEIESWIKALAGNGGNFIRLWLSNPFFDVEHEKSGQYDESRARRIDAVLEVARRHNVRVKMTLEHFRHFFEEQQRWAAKPQHHVSQGGPADSVDDFFQGRRSREQFLRKLDWFAERYGDDPQIFAWELWNEINAVRGTGWAEWTEFMLPELKKRFPRNLVTQSLGSFDTEAVRDLNRKFSLMDANQLAQVHRYLDLGARLEVCHGPMDLLSADAIRELRQFGVTKPMLLAEGGAVEPNHTGPFRLYDKDQAGILLHDVLFAPFFAGAAGPGQIWHWDRYVVQQDLWHHFGRFAETVKGLDPAVEGFEPIEIEHPRLRILALRGKSLLLAWCRDKENTWQTELAQGQAPEELTGLRVDLTGFRGAASRVRSYDPWMNQWTELTPQGRQVALPAFSRSLVLRIE
jgi:hypothetical protein